MQKKSEVEKRKKKKRPVGRPCKAPQQRMSQSAKSTALMTHEEDREMRLRWRDRWRDEGMKVPFGRWLAADALVALAGEVADAVTQCLLPRVEAAHFEAREARRRVEEALGISKGG